MHKKKKFAVEHHNFMILGKLFSLYQMTPLHLAAERGSIRIVKYLVEQGAEINIRDNNGVSVTILE